MADFDTSYAFSQANEDRAQAHAIVPDAPAGAHAISGINSTAFPTEFAVIANTPQSERGPLVKDFYRRHFWNQWFDKLVSNEVAERVFDCAVNCGMTTSVRLLQTAVRSLGHLIIVDGQWGAATVGAANSCDESELVVAERTARRNRYLAIIAAHPEDLKYEDNWLARVAE
jgi:hypothetical protein